MLGSILKRIRGGTIVSAAFLLTLGLLVTVSPAVAAPAADPPQVRTQAEATAGTMYVSDLQYQALSLVARAMKSTNGSTVMNYDTVVSIFRSAPDNVEVQWRRQMAAAWLIDNNTFTNMSRTEREIVNLYRTKYARPADRAITAAAPNCRGISGYSYLAEQPKPHWNYRDSCDTNKLKGYLGYWCIGGATLIGALATLATKDASVTAVTAMVVFGCAGALAWVEVAQSNSDLNAIIIKTVKAVDTRGTGAQLIGAVDPQ